MRSGLALRSHAESSSSPRVSPRLNRASQDRLRQLRRLLRPQPLRSENLPLRLLPQLQLPLLHRRHPPDLLRSMLAPPRNHPSQPPTTASHQLERLTSQSSSPNRVNWAIDGTHPATPEGTILLKSRAAPSRVSKIVWPRSLAVALHPRRLEVDRPRARRK